MHVKQLIDPLRPGDFPDKEYANPFPDCMPLARFRRRQNVSVKIQTLGNETDPRAHVFSPLKLECFFPIVWSQMNFPVHESLLMIEQIFFLFQF